MAFDLIAELEALVDALEADHVEYALCGGLALAIHGHPRATQDIDLLVPAASLEAAKAAAKRIGFDVPARKMTFGLAEGKNREVQRISKLDDATGALLALDLLVVSQELDGVWDARQTRSVRGRRITVVSRDGLATMKRIAGRLQDLADLEKLEGNDDG